MLCEQCRMREASIVIREVVNGTVTERNLCSECASQSDLGGILMDSSSPFAKLLSGILGISDSRRSEEEDASKLSCPTCGMTYKALKRYREIIPIPERNRAFWVIKRFMQIW